MEKIEQTKIIPIKGMHCRSCEILVEEELTKIPGVNKVNVSEKKGTAEISYSGIINENDIKKAVEASGYSLGSSSKTWVTKDLNEYYELMKAILIAVILYFIAKNFGFFNQTFNNTTNLTSLSAVFLIGLTAGFSTCMALVGGLVLGVSARYAEKHPHASIMSKFAPHIVFNVGRVISFIVLGALIGYFGSFFKLSPAFIGFLIILAGFVMLILGLQTIGIFPKLENFRYSLPKSLYKNFGLQEKATEGYKPATVFLLGGLTFFVPCGFTQAVQLYSLSSGNALTGALTMGIFALGTTPGLLSLGGVASAIKGSFAKMFFKFVGLIVILLAIFNISNGYNLLGIDFAKPATNHQSEAPLVENEQVIKMTQTYNGYTPSNFTVRNNVPVKWVIDSKDSYSCAASIYSAPLKINQNLNAGENIIEFTPNRTGKIKFTCSMGMFTGYINVVD